MTRFSRDIRGKAVGVCVVGFIWFLIYGSRDFVEEQSLGSFLREVAVAVRIRMQMMGRKHRPYFRIVAIDHKQPRNGRVLEQLGTYDPSIVDKESRVKLIPDRIKHWMSVGAKPSENVQVFLNKYMKKFEDAQAAAAPVPQG